jgi:F-type H+-transporting ATPase subunit gamma
MTRRQELEHHRHSLDEIRGIMNSMKTLAYMETRRLANYAEAQQAVVQGIEEAAADFLTFHPESIPVTGDSLGARAFIIIGTDRGFCGDFNQALLKQVDAFTAEQSIENPVLIAVGRKLCTLLENDARVAARLEGASVAEELSQTLSAIVDTLNSLRAQQGSLTVHAFYHNNEGDIVSHRLLPAFGDHSGQATDLAEPPVLNLPPALFFVELAEHFLMAVLQAMLYASLSAENQRRVVHLEGAVRHLDDESSRLALQCSTLRQEEIIEEIEVILLSAGDLGG